jgi:hypothetical protein
MARSRFVDHVGVDIHGLHAGPVPSGPAPRIATDWVHTTHPETGLDVVFKAGEALPDWVPNEDLPSH